MLSSSYVDQEYKIFVALPHGYADPHKTYPVLYVLDANLAFGTFAETTRLLQYGKELPETIIVGIGYPVNDLRETLGPRARDFTPTADPEAAVSDATGGAGDFLQFIRKELIPFIQSDYRVDPKDRALAGVSLSGLFALYTLFHHPDTFGRYVIGSPTIEWDDAVTFTFESDFAARNADLSAKVFMSAGALEGQDTIANVQKLAQRLADRGYASLELETHIFEGETHRSGWPAAMIRGLRTVFG
jgi:predicted alpha/beta superfamily hydrolase